jgi:thiol:disulfide interchange protein
MKSIIFLVLLIAGTNAFAIDTTKLYDPKANAEKDMAVAMAKARQENKHVLIQVGGNWCYACYRFNDFLLSDPAINELLEKDYVVYHLNYSKENWNMAYLKKLGHPQTLGFPTLVVLNANGQILTRQSVTRLATGNRYDKQKVKDFLIGWRPLPSNKE